MKKVLKMLLTVCLTLTMFVLLTGCNEQSTNPNNPESFSAKDAIKIEEIDWSVVPSVMDGERYFSLNYTNNSKYTILGLEIKFTLKEDITEDELSIFDKLKKENEWTDEDMEDLYIQGVNQRVADPKETVKDSPCAINGYENIENVEQFEIMEPDMATIVFIANDGKGYMIYYDFKSQTYGESSNGGKELQNWPSVMLEVLPKVETVAVDVSSDDEDYMYVQTFGITKDYFNEYKNELKKQGFTTIDYEWENSYSASNEDGYSVSISYTAINEKMTITLKKNKDE